MNAGGETADQVVKMSLEGIEVAANIALKAVETQPFFSSNALCNLNRIQKK